MGVYRLFYCDKLYIYIYKGKKIERNQGRDQKYWRWNEVFCSLDKHASMRRQEMIGLREGREGALQVPRDLPGRPTEHKARSRSRFCLQETTRGLDQI